MNTRIRYCRLTGAGPIHLQSPAVSIEVVITPGIPRHTVVGLARGAVREALDRIRGAILSSGYRFPRGAITVNLAPADTQKEGSALDLPIALGILVADGQVSRPADLAEIWLSLGELALDGSVRPVSGVMVALMSATRFGQQRVILPEGNLPEAQAFPHLRVYPIPSLRAAVEALGGGRSAHVFAPGSRDTLDDAVPDFVGVIGQETTIRALQVAAAGRHNIRLIGPPGCGKTFMARCFPGILPGWRRDQAIETTCLHSLHRPGTDLLPRRPFRSPHHTVSAAGMLGGGTPIRPGEVSLAHNGVLFLDELPEFDRSVLEGLREPLQEGRVAISRAGGVEIFPAGFQLLAAMNPCPCGMEGSEQGACRCTARDLDRYRRRLSRPILDRIDLHVSVPPVDPEQSLAMPPARTAELSEGVRSAARRLMDNPPVIAHEEHEVLIRAASGMGLSMRALERTRRICLTIAALDRTDRVQKNQVAEALRYRETDR
ncbi:MAG: YifB family Mg chelatase-like AAA ATPase [Bacteroidetes bacterium]|nr:YifB family Mg chelatase-like AAA ATPase [Bacteroidota bacterium]